MCRARCHPPPASACRGSRPGSTRPVATRPCYRSDGCTQERIYATRVAEHLGDVRIEHDDDGIPRENTSEAVRLRPAVVESVLVSHVGHDVLAGPSSACLL